MPKISIQIVPSFRELINLCKNGVPHLFSQFNKVYFVNRSATSIRVLCDALYEEKGRIINVWIPDYFCGETLGTIRGNDKFNLVFYPINEKLLPDYKTCSSIAAEKSPDLFIFVHYFGMNLDVASAKNFCRNNNSLLIEDCAHVIYPIGKYGLTGDFALFSLHKCLSLADGAALCVNTSERVSDSLVKKIADNVAQLKRYDSLKDYFKLFLKKIIHINSSGTYSYMPHYDDGGVNMSLYRISKLSENLLSAYEESDIRRFVYNREHNLRMIISLIEKFDLPVKPVVNADGAGCPYLCVYEITDENSSLRICDVLRKAGFPLGVWTCLPKEIKGQNADTAENFSKKLFTIPIHQNIKEEKLIRSFSNLKIQTDTDVELVIYSEGRDKWNTLLKNADFAAITQDYTYGEIKANFDRGKQENFLIKVKGECVGVFQAIVKSYLFIKIVRINKGPVIFDRSNTDLVHETILAIKRHYRHNVLVITPEISYSPENTEILIKEGFHKLNNTNKFTSFVDLTQTEADIRQNLKSKWRNQLKTAEKKEQYIEEITDDFDMVIALYEQYMKEKNFSGIPVSYLRKMKEKSPDKFKIYGDYLNNELIAFDIAYIHGDAATYLVGWESDSGREVYANNYLLFHMILALKKLGVRVLDLGGLGIISAPSIAKFKLGVCNKIFEYCGDYYTIV